MQALIDALFKQALQQAASVPVVTDKDAVHVDEAQRVGKRGGHVAAVPFQRGGAGSVARSRGADGVGPAFGRCAAGFGGIFIRISEQRSLACVALQASAAAAGTLRSLKIDGNVSKLAAQSRHAVEQCSVEDHARADTVPDLQVKKAFKRLPRSIELFRERGGRNVVQQHAGQTGRI